MKLALKWLSEDGSAYHGGSGKWALPTTRKPGAWMPTIEGTIEPCHNGYHLCRLPPKLDMLSWCAPALFVAEYRGTTAADDDKIAVREARLLVRVTTWNERSARLFACDCAQRVLPLYEKEAPDDDRPRKSIETARLFAKGRATQKELAAARDAARAAAWAAAGDAAWAAARAAARDAARAAAWAAAWAAARDAARAAEKKWQLENLAGRLDLDRFIGRAKARGES